MLSMYEAVEMKKLELEDYVKRLQYLLRPWPPPEAEKQDDKGPEKPVEKEEVSDPVENMTVQEKTELALVENLLTKAQKARDLQKKINEPKRVKDKHISNKSTENVRNGDRNQEKNPTKLSKDDNGNASESGDKSTRQHECISTSGKQDKQVDPSATNRTASQSALKGRQTAPGVKNANQSRSSASRDRTNASQLNREQVTRGQTSGGRGQSGRVVERPSSGTGKRRTVPAHVSAPFQTNPRLATGKLQTTYRAATSSRGRGRGTDRVSSAGRGGHSSRTVDNKAVSSKPPVSTSDRQSPENSFTDTNQNDNNLYDQFANTRLLQQKQTDVVVSSQTERIAETKKSSQPHTVSGDVASRFEQLNIQGSGQGSEETGVKEADCDRKNLFDLRTQGSKLVIPPRLRKYFSHNTRLRQKLFMKTVTRKVESNTEATTFPSQLQHVFGEDGDIKAQNMSRNVQHALNICTTLQTLLSSLHLDDVTVAGEMPAADTLRAKNFLEFILQTFQETEEFVHSLDLGAVANAVVWGRELLSVPSPAISSASVWYPATAGQPTIPSLEDWKPSPVISYRSVRELETYRQVLHRIQVLQLQSEIMDTVAMEIFPLLQSMDPASSDYVQVLRSGYAMLSMSQSQPPVIVRDTIQELDDTIIDDS